MSRLIVVSNRVADPSAGPQSGGLAVALLDALREMGGIWFGWDGTIAEDAGARAPSIITEGEITIATVPLTQEDYDEYYLGFSNSALWPVFHNRLDLARFDHAHIEGYRRVNERFARHLADLIRPGDLLWVHDYHLIPLAAELRRLGLTNRMGFFLHIPFPSPDVIVATPEHDWLARSFLQYDLIGFQTSSDLINFRRFLRENHDAIGIGDASLSTFGRTTTAAVFPIGIDVEAFEEMATTDEAQKIIEALGRRLAHRTHIIGVDRLDYTKGLPERLRAFRRLLESYPQNVKQVTLMQIAAPTRETVDAYVDIREELERESGAINGEFADFDWTPVRYIHRSIPRATLAALFRGSHVGLVTPLRDGMNLVAKEYVAAQDPEDPGVLVLSRFAGAAEDLEEALIVNPYDADETADALQQALSMPLEERRQRHAALLGRVRERDAHAWRESYVHVLRDGIEHVGAA
jgi:trehalose 6-phosphate synthase